MNTKDFLIGFAPVQLQVLRWIKNGGGMIDSAKLQSHVVQLIQCGALVLQGPISHATLQLTERGEMALRMNGMAA